MFLLRLNTASSRRLFAPEDAGARLSVLVKSDDKKIRLAAGLGEIEQAMKKSDPIHPTRCAQQLSALAAPERIKIVRFLGNGPKNVTEIAEMLKTLPVNVAHHMGVLRQAGIVRGRKQGRFVYYALEPGFLQADVEAGQREYFNLGCCRLEVPPSQDAGSS
jgi:DNA-binding transcriptional ArsR family regulator